MDLYRQPNCAEVADFFGSVNWLSGTLVQSKFVDTKIGRFEVCVKGDPGPEVLVGFRPESLQITDKGKTSGPNCFEAALRSSTFLGDQFVYDAIVKDELLIGKSRVVPARRDCGIQLYVDPADILVFPGAERKDHLLSLQQRS
jgi:ABC-type Fe3+/spermidine/putrescine transport system ATPase subunit